MKRSRLFLQRMALLIGATVSVPSLSADGRAIVARGNGKAAPCATCHGAQGEGLAGGAFVRLAGLSETYLVKQLHDFKNGARRNPVMQPMAAGLSDTEIAAVARYYASQPRPKAPADPRAPSNHARGKQLALQGLWEKNVPACFQCHGPGGAGVPPHFPPIAGQPADYIVEQFDAWRAGRRKNDPVGLMQAVAGRLSPEDVQAVAQFLASHRGSSERATQ